MLKRFNRWYDDLVEPWRFLFFILVLMGWVPIIQWTDDPYIMGLGITWMITTCVIALSRLSRIR